MGSSLILRVPSDEPPIVILMNKPTKHQRTARLLLLVVIVGVVLGLTSVGGMYLASYATHFIWLAVTKAQVSSVENFPLWLWIPATTITVGLIWLVSCILQRLRLRERLVGDEGGPHLQ